MAFVTPYTTDKYITYKGDTITTYLSMAIWLIDDFTGEQAAGNIRVVIKGKGIEALKNLSRYYIFTDLANGEYIVDIFSDLYFFYETKIDTSKIKITDLILQFAVGGPKKGETVTKLKDISKLQNDDIVEFHNPAGDIEQKDITVDASTGTISWLEGLKYDFNDGDSTILALKNPVVTIRLNPLPSYPFPNNATLIRGSITDADKNPVAEARLEVKSKNININTESDENGEFVLYFTNIDFSNNENKPISIKIDIENGNKGSCNQTLEEGVTKYLKIKYSDRQFQCDIK